MYHPMSQNDMRYVGQYKGTRKPQQEKETEDAIKRFERKYLHKKN